MAAKLAAGDLMLEFKGVAKGLAFRKAVSKNNNDYWAVLRPTKSGERKLSQFGVKIPALDTSLPGTAYIVDPESKKKVEVRLESGVTNAYEGKGGGNPKVQFRGKTTLPNGQERMLTLVISQTQGGEWNVIAKAVGIGGGGGAATVDVDDL